MTPNQLEKMQEDVRDANKYTLEERVKMIALIQEALIKTYTMMGVYPNSYNINQGKTK